MKVLLIASLAVLLAACSGPAPVPLSGATGGSGAGGGGADDRACGAQTYGRWVGRAATDLEKTLILKPVRVIRPGDPVTRDYVPTRLNFEINGSGRIARVFCG